jgi:hypothetical protein
MKSKSFGGAGISATRAIDPEFRNDHHETHGKAPKVNPLKAISSTPGK